MVELGWVFDLADDDDDDDDDVYASDHTSTTWPMDANLSNLLGMKHDLVGTNKPFKL